MEQKSFLLFMFDFSSEFSAPPEFSSGVPVKYLSTGWARSFGIHITNEVFYHCATASLFQMLLYSYCYLLGFSGRICSYWPRFSGRNCNYWLGFSGLICSYWPRWSGHTCSYWPGFSSLSVVSCRDFPAVTFPE